MNFIKSYGLLAISFLVLYGLFIFGSISGFIGVTGNVVNSLTQNKSLFVYGGIGLAGLILGIGIIWGIVRLVRKRKKKKELFIKSDVKPKLKLNQKINDLLIEGEKNLVDQNISEAKNIYKKIKLVYIASEDPERQIYNRIMDYYNNLIKEKK